MVPTSDEFELKFPELSRAELGHTVWDRVPKEDAANFESAAFL